MAAEHIPKHPARPGVSCRHDQSFYAAADGRILWEYDTAHPYEAVNGVAAKGGSLNGPSSVIVNGMVFMNSGYAYLGYGVPGNVLLAFGVE